MKKQIIISAAISLYFLLPLVTDLAATAGMGSQDSTERPSSNYLGTLEDSSGKRTTVEYLAIGSRTTTSNIPVYGQLTGPRDNPRNKTTFLDLQQIRALQVVMHPGISPIVIDGTTYLEVAVTLKGSPPVTKNFLIEATRKIWCDEVIEGAPSIPQEIQLAAVKKITIVGARLAAYRYRLDPGDRLDVPEQERRKNYSCNEAAKALAALERAVEGLPEQHKVQLQSLVEPVQNWVGGLCSG